MLGFFFFFFMEESRRGMKNEINLELVIYLIMFQFHFYLFLFHVLYLMSIIACIFYIVCDLGALGVA